jgi:hypothetical protein
MPSNEIEAVMKSPNKEEPRIGWIHSKFYQVFTEEITPVLQKMNTIRLIL